MTLNNGGELRQTMAKGLVWISSQPTPYNDFLFRQINCQVAPFEVWYRKAGSTTHPWKTPLGEGYAHKAFQPRMGADWCLILDALRRRETMFVVAGWIEPTQLILLSTLRCLRRRYAVWTDTPNTAKQRHPIYGRLRAAWLRWIFRGARAVLGTGRPGVEALDEMGAPKGRTVEFPFVLDLPAYKRTDWSTSDSSPMRFVSSGRLLNQQKGHDIALRALAQASRVTGRSFEYFIAGTGPDMKQLLDLARRLGIEQHVFCLGWVEPSELIARMKASHVLIHPSPTHDPFPNAILEGMAAGMGVLGSDASGSARDRIVHGVNGLIHRAGDEEGLCEQIMWCLMNPPKVARLGQAAEETAQKWPVERSIAIIHRLLLDRSAEPATSPVGDSTSTTS